MKRLLFLFLFILTISTFINISCDDDPPELGLIYGTVKDNNGNLLKDVVVTLTPYNGSSVFTSENGYYEFKELKYATYSLQVTKEGYEPQEKGNIPVQDTETQVDFVITEQVPEISVSLSSLNFVEDETEKSFTITNTGNGTLEANMSSDKTWISFIPGSTISLDESQAQIVKVNINKTGLDPGNYSGILLINSNGGNPVQITITMNIPEPNQTPTANFTVDSQSGNVNTTFSFDASGCEDDNTALSALQVRWQWETDGTFTDWTTNKQATHKYTTAGTYIVTFEVKDEHDAKASTTKQITVAALNTHATLSSLTTNIGELNPTFSSTTYNYTVELPYGTTTIPTVSATTTDANATKIITQATSLTGTATVDVTAEDGTTVLTYTTVFSVAPNNVATLSSLSTSAGTLDPVFSSSTYNYDVVLPYGTTTIPTVSATTTDANATKTITQATSVTGTATVDVTAEDGITMQNYTIVFSVSTSETVTDIEGNVYQTVTIGTQTWMAENLKSTKYADGTSLVDGAAAGDISGNYTTKYYFSYDNDDGNVTTYGRLYTWAAAMNGFETEGAQGVCPNGWHLPTDSELKTLEMYLGMSQAEADNTGYRGTNEGSKLAGNASLWTDGALDSNAEFGSSGFTALAGGYRIISGSFYGSGYLAYFWSSSPGGSSSAWGRYLSYDNAAVHRFNNTRSYGFSVRCLRDN